MVWGKKIPFCLFCLQILLHEVFCDGIFKSECSTGTCECGETVTITCTLTHPLEKINLKEYNRSLLSSNLPTREKLITEDGKISIDCTDDEVKINISNVKFSDYFKYTLVLTANAPPLSRTIHINVSGVCEPTISENKETKELRCEAESKKDASIAWMDKHGKLYRSANTKEPHQLTFGFRLQSSLNWTEEMRDNGICCSVSYLNGAYKESCSPETLGVVSEQLSSKSPTSSILIVLLAVACVAAAFGYLLKRRNRIVIRDRSLSQGRLMGKEAPEEDNATHPPLVQPSSV